MGNQNSSQTTATSARTTTGTTNQQQRRGGGRPNPNNRRTGSPNARTNNNNNNASNNQQQNNRSSTATTNNNNNSSSTTTALQTSTSNNNQLLANQNHSTIAQSVLEVINAGDTTQLDFLLNSVKNFDINRPLQSGKEGGNPALHAAVHGTVNTLELVKLLEKHGANLNGLNGDGETPLIIAVSADREDVVRLLLELGADVDVPSSNGAPPLYYALAKRCRAVMPAIFLRRPNVNFLTQESESILHAAVRFGELEVVNAVVNQLRVYQGGRVQMPPMLPSVIERFAGPDPTTKKTGQDDEDENNSEKKKQQSEENTSRKNDDENDDDDDQSPSTTTKTTTLRSKYDRRALINPNSFEDDDPNYRRWANTSSLCDAKSTSVGSMNVCPIGIAIHNAINSANSVSIGTKSSQVAHYLASVRTDMMMEEHLDIPRW